MSNKLAAEEQLEKLQAQKLKKLDLSKFMVHKLDTKAALKHLEADQKNGLSTAEAKKRLEKYGGNELEPEKEKSLFESIMEQFEDVLVQILLASATISFIIALTGDGEEGLTAYVEPFVILLILVLNGIVAIWQDRNAESALEALIEMQASESTTLRDGKWSVTPAKELVPGDIVRIKEGECVPADMRIVHIESITLQVEEGALTGESESVIKTDAALPNAPMLQDQLNMLFSSTIISEGQAVGVVSYTGMGTAIGSVHQEVQEAKEDEEDTPLKQKIDKFGDLLAKVIFVICFLVWAMNFKKFSDPIHGSFVKGCIYYFKIAVALAVAAIPEGLPAVITTCLALGTRKMAEKECIVRRLQSVETLGCTSVICSDKTGTLTQNQMFVERFGIVKSDGSAKMWDIEQTQNAYSPEGKILSSFDEMVYQNTPAVKHLAAACALNNRAKIEFNSKKNAFQIMGSPTDGAIKVLAEKIGKYDINAPTATSNAKRSPMSFADFTTKKLTEVAVLDFSSQRKCMSTIYKNYPGSPGNTVFSKGAPERMIERCTQYYRDGSIVEFLNNDVREQLNNTIKNEASKGFRVLGLAVKIDEQETTRMDQNQVRQYLCDKNNFNNIESDLTFLGFVCIRDPIRKEVKGAIEQCKTAGVNVIMITGDARETAINVAQELNIIDRKVNVDTVCFTGAQFEKMSAKEKIAALSGNSGKVFCRVIPSHKRDLVKILIEQGEIVAMTGDGVNDAPALKQAHIGVAMGITGTEVAKRASDMVLANDNFATIVSAVEEGRSIYSNMKAFIRYLISSNIGEVASIFFTAMIGIPEGFNSVQLLWVNLVTDGPPATALGFNPPDKDVMQKPPRKKDEGLISNWVFFRYMVIGMYVGVATVGIFVYWYTMAETGDNHTLVTFEQLSHWSECPTWTDFKVNNFVEGLDFTNNPCDYFVKGKVKASTLSLSVLVVIEMLNALNAISEDNSLLVMTPFVNPWLILAIANSIVLHAVIVYVPFLNEIFSIHAMNTQEWILVFAFSFPVILIDEVLKFFGRIKNAAELKQRLKQD